MALIASPLDLPPGRLLALDLGQARHGAATCDEAGILATPLQVIPRARTRAQDFAVIAELVRRERTTGVLVGLPGGNTETSSAQARWVRRYAGCLAGALDVPVAFWDETLSTVDAARLLADVGGRTQLDAAAAAIFLQDFLDVRRLRLSSDRRIPGRIQEEC